MEARLDLLIEYMRSSGDAESTQPILVPGEREARVAEEQTRLGIALPTRRSCRATPPPMKKSRIESRCSDTRERAHIVARNQTTRRIWVGAGTTPCRA